MFPITLDKPGRRYVFDAGDAFRVYRHTFGCLEIERIEDGATAFFQGEDAATLEDELASAADAPMHGNPCDIVCGQYTTILQAEA
jgi:hypothetical protein